MRGVYCDESFGPDLDDTAGTSDFGQPRSRDAGIPDCKKVNVSLVRAIAEAACGEWETRTARWNPRLRRGNTPDRPWRSRSASNREQRYRARQTAPAVSPRRGRSGLRDCGHEKGQSGKTVNSHERAVRSVCVWESQKHVQCVAIAPVSFILSLCITAKMPSTSQHASITKHSFVM